MIGVYNGRGKRLLLLDNNNSTGCGLGWRAFVLSLIFDASVLFGISVLYGANVLFFRRSGIPFFTCYFNDICAGVWFMAYTNLLLRIVKIRMFHLKSVIAYILIWGLIWEYGAPLIYLRSTSDPMDLVCYEIGAVLYWSMMVFVRSCL